MPIEWVSWVKILPLNIKIIPINCLIDYRFYSNHVFKGPNELIVNLKNESDHLMEINGVYNLGPDLNNTNGFPYWLQKDGKLAIWKSPDNDWIFGNKENIGSSSWNGISSSGKSTGPYDAAKWTYTTSRWHFAFDLDLNIEFDMLEKVDAVSIGKYICLISFFFHFFVAVGPPW